MKDPRFELDPQGDTILILRYPNKEQPVWEPQKEVTNWTRRNRIIRQKLFNSESNPDKDAGPSDSEGTQEPTPESIAPDDEPSVPNDGRDAREQNSKSNEVQFRLSSRHLALASPVFKTMLNGTWKESAAPSGQSEKSSKAKKPLKNGSASSTRYELTATEWDDEVFLMLMNIIHGRHTLVPLSIDLITLVKMSVLVDYYQCQEVTQLVFRLWIKEFDLPTSYGRDCVAWIFVSWVFSYSDLFAQMTKLAMRTSEGGFGTIYLPLPPTLLTAMERKRDQFLDIIFNVLGNLCQHLCKGRRGCNFECSAILLGSLLKGMDEHKLYQACSARRVRRVVLSLESGAERRCVCTLQRLLRPEFDRAWLIVDGLRLKDYKVQKRKFADVS
ncbi:hypothetical protein E4U17_004740 [Claviceps sp. LM77 group G4]|nr:hypothetical protein E4U17_004740 [Claviceps sp. LM77 group G4]KAG6070756.1 hypothetical protein E4U33_004040 [Claviceps sp. LM78 group G4]KAG6076634.1 hypothetical protein E4U16_002661 [Claviceps sp. LM84 group G4]